MAAADSKLVPWFDGSPASNRLHRRMAPATLQRPTTAESGVLSADGDRSCYAHPHSMGPSRPHSMGPRAATGPAKRPSSWPPRPRSTMNTGPNTHHSPTHWLYCFSMIILARPGATVAMDWSTVHDKTSHGPPTEPTVRPSNGVGWARIGRTLNTISPERLRDGCAAATGCQ